MAVIGDAEPHGARFGRAVTQHVQRGRSGLGALALQRREALDFIRLEVACQHLVAQALDAGPDLLTVGAGGKQAAHRAEGLAHVLGDALAAGLIDAELGQRFGQFRAGIATGTRPAGSAADGRVCAGQAEAHRRVGHAQYVFPAPGDDVDVGRHAGQQAPARIGRADDDGVSHDIALFVRCQPDLSDLALELAVGEGVDAEARVRTLAHATDVGFIDTGLDLDLIEVLSDGEQHWCLQAGGDGLAEIDRPVDHHTVDRRADLGAFEVDLGCFQRCFALLDRGLRVQVLGTRDSDVGARGLPRGLGRIQRRFRNAAASDQ